MISLTNSLKMYVISLFISFPLSILFSYYLFKRFSGHKILRFIVMLPNIISAFIICLLFKKFVESTLPNVMRDLGFPSFPNLITDNRYMFGTTVFYMIWISFSGALIIYPNAMNGIPDDIIEQSKIDGINNDFQELWYIVLPLIFPTISTFLITGFAAILTTEGPLVAFFMYSAPSSVYNMGYYYLVQVKTGNIINYPQLAAGGLLLTIVVAPLTYLLKYVLEKFGPEAEY